MGIWQLFIDESGPFDTGHPAVVGGVLVREADSAVLDGALRTRLGAVFPGIAYPPHANRWNRAAFSLLPVVAAGETGTREVQRALTDARAFVNERVRPVWNDPSARKRLDDRLQQAAALERGRRPGFTMPLLPECWGPESEMSEAFASGFACYPLLKTLDRWLSRELTDIRPLQAVAGAFELGIKSILENAAGQPSENALVVVGCFDPHASTDESRAPRDAYLRALYGVVQRVAWLLSATPPPTRPAVRLRVCTRQIEDQRGQRRSLTPNDLSTAISALQPIAGSPGRPYPPVFYTTGPDNYDANVPAGAVLADFVVNRLYRILPRATSWRGGPREVVSWARQDLRSSVELQPRWHAGGALPAIAVEGEPRRALEAAWNGGPPAELSSAPPPWGAEQARIWLGAL